MKKNQIYNLFLLASVFSLVTGLLGQDLNVDTEITPGQIDRKGIIFLTMGCTGTVVSSHLIMTAAHCLTELKNGDVVAKTHREVSFAAENNLTITSSANVTAREFVIAEEFVSYAHEMRNSKLIPWCESWIKQRPYDLGFIVTEEDLTDSYDLETSDIWELSNEATLQLPSSFILIGFGQDDKQAKKNSDQIFREDFYHLGGGVLNGLDPANNLVFFDAVYDNHRENEMRVRGLKGDSGAPLIAVPPRLDSPKKIVAIHVSSIRPPMIQYQSNYCGISLGKNINVLVSSTLSKKLWHQALGIEKKLFFDFRTVPELNEHRSSN